MAQYQHYIPQFLLRNFSHPYRPLKSKGAEKRQRGRVEKGKHRGEKVLNVVDLTADEPRITEVPVSRWFGQEEMYSDIFSTIKSKKDVEQGLSRLECQTATILQKVKKAHENGDQGIRLTRIERNHLRKFLFIMKYRGPGYFEKYLSQDPQSYNSEDKHLVRDYMVEKGFATPRDVWLHNIRTILNLDMDAEGRWRTKLQDTMFPADAAMFVFHIEHSYIALCTPEENGDEFILTDQAYNLFEGPTHNTFCGETHEYMGETYMCFHEFAPVSPRLMIVLRSNVLPEALEDKDSRKQKIRQRMQNMAAALFPEPENVTSILEDLPVAKAMNSYSRVINGKLELAPGQSGSCQSRDTFTFRFWPIPTRHMNIINAIFLDNLLICNSIVLSSIVAFRQTLVAYMTTQACGFKSIGVGEYRAKATRFARLEKLALVLKTLGAENVPIFYDHTGIGKSFTCSLDDQWLEVVKRMFDGAENPFDEGADIFWQTYRLLGGTNQTFLKDLEQSWRLYQLQSQVSLWTVGLESRVQNNAFAYVLDLILRHHPKRVWLYVKHRRWMTSKEYAMHQHRFVGTGPIFAAKTAALFEPQREDFVVQANHNTDDDRLCHLIYFSGVLLDMWR
ncbi:hypothetical protein BKA67DRAFT_543484 [Truncatella angustata]|uniref:DUF4238 domain-containing protein n=1 Tax=Truncatella angustata TaxID=152316 RepID=A0A9P9A125_9PEZI|nr:uncharacterized protein BKA67DRAFT_543484 [Truncatella angustata]KAH6659071.1 hypothetical protein BKA67DRAFT_543484 [Truncatella angustata]